MIQAANRKMVEVRGKASESTVLVPYPVTIEATHETNGNTTIIGLDHQGVKDMIAALVRTL